MFEEDEIEQDPTAVNFIPCICFVKRGVAKEQPEKVCVCVYLENLIILLNNKRMKSHIS